MKIVFLGVGEAFDENHSNTSILVESKSRILLDCGYSMPQNLWRFSSEPNLIDAIYISHQHADHTFGIPAVLLRMWEDSRSKALTFLCTLGMKDYILKLIEMGYKGLIEKRRVRIDFLEFERETVFNEFKVSVAQSQHSAVNHAIRLEANNKVICYSGDGMFTEETVKLYENADLLVHDSYNIESVSGHAGITELIDMASSQNVKTLALVHISRKLRRDKDKIERLIKGSQMKIIIPETFDEVEI